VLRRSLSISIVVVLATLVAPAVTTAPASAVELSTNGLIAFRSDHNGVANIYTMDATGGSLTDLTRSAGAVDMDPAWSPDGSMIALARRPRPTFKSDLFLMNAKGVIQARVTTTGVPERDPAWSPDGTILAYEARTWQSGPFRIFTIRVGGLGRTQLTRQAAGTYDANPSWSPDGTKIVFESNRNRGFPELYVMNANGFGQTRLTYNRYVDADPAWSPDGTRIAFVRCCPDGSSEIYVMNADGTGQVDLTNTSDMQESQPAWSPDGSMIAYAAVPSAGGNIDVYVMNADGTGQTRLTTDPAPDMAPSWQPVST
jgi:Tol biopolymer transport system component